METAVSDQLSETLAALRMACVAVAQRAVMAGRDLVHQEPVDPHGVEWEWQSTADDNFGTVLEMDGDDPTSCVGDLQDVFEVALVSASTHESDSVIAGNVQPVRAIGEASNVYGPAAAHIQAWGPRRVVTLARAMRTLVEALQSIVPEDVLIEAYRDQLLKALDGLTAAWDADR